MLLFSDGNVVKSDSPNTSPGKDSDISPPSTTDKTHMNIPHADTQHTPTPPIGGTNLRLKTFAPLPRDTSPHTRDAGVVNNLNKDSEVNGNRVQPYPSNCVHSNNPRWPVDGKTIQYHGGYQPSPNANKLQVLDHPTHVTNHVTSPTANPNGKKKGVRFAENPSVMVGHSKCPLAQDEDYASSVEGLSDDGTTTSGSYIVSDNNDVDSDHGGVRLGISNEGTVV